MKSPDQRSEYRGTADYGDDGWLALVGYIDVHGATPANPMAHQPHNPHSHWVSLGIDITGMLTRDPSARFKVADEEVDVLACS